MHMVCVLFWFVMTLYVTVSFLQFDVISLALGKPYDYDGKWVAIIDGFPLQSNRERQ